MVQNYALRNNLQYSTVHIGHTKDAILIIKFEQFHTEGSTWF